MSISWMPAGPRYVRVIFNNEEISIIQAACTAVALRERYLMMEDAAYSDLDTAASQARKASDTEMAEGLASMFKPDQEILIEPEDLALVLDSLKAYSRSTPEEHDVAVKNLIKKIERYCCSG